MKKVFVGVVGYEFDVLPAHTRISAGGQASTKKVAVARAMNNLMRDSLLRRKHVGEFKVAVKIETVTEEVKS